MASCPRSPGGRRAEHCAPMGAEESSVDTDPSLSQHVTSDSEFSVAVMEGPHTRLDIAPLVSAFEPREDSPCSEEQADLKAECGWDALLEDGRRAQPHDSREVAKPTRARPGRLGLVGRVLRWERARVAGDTELRDMKVPERHEAQAPPMKETVSSCEQDVATATVDRDANNNTPAMDTDSAG